MYLKKNQKEFENVSCIICGEENTRIVGKKGQFGIPVSVSICKNDGLVYLNPRWKKVHYKQFYSEEYYDKFYKIDWESNEPNANRFDNIKKILERIEKSNIEKVNSVLDIGSGMGWSLKYLKKTIGDHIHISAIESSNICKNHIIEEIGAELLTDDVDSNWHLNIKNKFDLIIMRHVFEHFLNPKEVLQKIYHVLNPKGHLYIAVPDMMSPRGSLRNYWFRIVHTHYYCKNTLEHIVQNEGFESLTINSVNSELWGIFKKRNKLFGSQFKSVYVEQMKVIKNHKRKYLFHDYIIHPTLSIIPTSIVFRIKSHFKKSF